MAGHDKPRLTYSKGRGRAESIRLTLVATGTEFDETIITSRDEFLQVIKDGKLLFNQLPLLEIGGLTLVGSHCIVRYIGQKGNLYGKNAEEKVKIDILMMGAKDFYEGGAGIYNFLPSQDNTIDEVLKLSNQKYLPAFEKTLFENGSGYLVGTSLSIGDICVFDVLTQIITDSPFPKLVSVLDNYPKCKAFVEHLSSLPRFTEYLGSPKRNPVPNKEFVKQVKPIYAFKL